MTALVDEKLDYIPLTFMLGFFVTIVVGRWGEIFNNIGSSFCSSSSPAV